jgi:predicted nucleic acid-binding protein
MALPFLDTNILLRHLSQDHPDHSPRATALLK